MTSQPVCRGAVSRRSILAAMPAGVLAGAAARAALAQPSAADPVSFYLGQVLALATLQAEAIGRLRPFLAAPNTRDGAWQSGTSAEAGVIGAVASVLGAMEPPPALSASVGELRLASAAYQSAAAAARNAASGDISSLTAADAGLAEGATHILLWLDALTAETANDWGDGLRTLTAGAAPVPQDEIALQPPAAPPLELESEEPGDGAPAEDEAARRQNREARQNRQPDQEPGDQPNRPNRQNRQNRPNREGRAAEE